MGCFASLPRATYPSRSLSPIWWPLSLRADAQLTPASRDEIRPVRLTTQYGICYVERPLIHRELQRLYEYSDAPT